MQMASLTADLLLFNGHSRRFIQSGFAWSFNFAGLADREAIQNPWSFDIYNIALSENRIRILLDVLVIGFLGAFLVIEFLKCKQIGRKVFCLSLFGWPTIPSEVEWQTRPVARATRSIGSRSF